MTENPILVAGAGPTGLTLACDLARRGVRCRVVDKAAQLFVGSRGKGLQPRTLEVFDDLGVIDAVLAAGAPCPSFRGYGGERVIWERSLHDMLGIPPASRRPDVPYIEAWLLPQWRTDEILRDRFVELGGQVELATELVGFEQDAAGVTATLRHGRTVERARFSYLVGADGGRSTVRKALGVGFAGETFETERTLIGDAEVDGPLDHEHCHILSTTGDISNPQRFSLWGLPGTDRFQFVANLGAAEEPDLTLHAIQRMLEQRSGRTDLRLHHLSWVSLYRINVRMADRFRVGRVFLAGDAAHVHSSAGGQGLNASVQDAYNLGWKLGGVLHGAPEDLLDTYEAERLPLAADLLGITTRWHRAGFQGPIRAATPSPSALPEIYQLGLNYRGGPLTVDDGDQLGSVHAGDRAPDAVCLSATGMVCRLFDAFRGPHCTVLAFGATHAATVAAVNAQYAAEVRAYRVLRPGETAAGASLIDIHGDIQRGFALDESRPGSLVLVRPDGYIGLIGRGAAVDSLREYLTHVTSGSGTSLTSGAARCHGVICS
jgi:2-polyprenyl-6-methoxyphenol hydroxylase-like FAD-dependent oxidoreductase